MTLQVLNVNIMVGWISGIGAAITAYDAAIAGLVNQNKNIWPNAFHGHSIGMKKLRATQG